jgi:arylsulfatase A-like enzyme
MYEGDWIIIRDDVKSPAELYNLKTDPLEANNLAAQEPERLQKMTAALDAHLAAAQLVPWQQPNQ